MHHITLVSFLLLRKNSDNLREFLGTWFTAPPRQKIARTPMNLGVVLVLLAKHECKF